MEPAAPGTEDEVKLSVLNNVSKKESEQERLLSIKTRLPSGKLGNVFELSFCNGSERWYCNLCECPIMGRVYHHEIGKRHTNNMQVAGNHYTHTIEPEPALQIAPGEPLPPGFEEGEVEKVAQIQERLDGFTVGPLIGLEYLFELQEYDREKEPSYLCLLCDKRGDPRTVIAHLASYNHIIQYTQRHFMKCFRALSPYITKQYKRNWQATMQKIAEAIENRFGRLKPHVVEREAFEAKRSYYQNLVATGPHCNEKNGVTFEELVDKEQLTRSLDDDITMTKLSEDVSKRVYRKTGTEPGCAEDKKAKRSPSPPVVAKPKKPKTSKSGGEKRRSSLSSCSTISSSDLSEFDPALQPPPKKIKESEVRRKQPPWERTPFNRRGGSRSRSTHRRYDRRSRSRSHSPHRTQNKKSRNHGAVHPWQRSDYIRSRNDTSADRNKQKSDKMEEFKKLATAIENDMERILKQHEKNPEKHPQYNEEWKKFWNKRYKELQAEGKDAATYDFKPEWIEFWNKRMTELHNAEIKTKKDALRKRLGLPEEPAPISFKITGKKKQDKGQKEEAKDSKLAPLASVPDQDPDVIVIEDKDEDTVSSKRSHSPWESEPGSRPSSRHSREQSREHSRGRSKEKPRISRDRSRERKHRSRDHDRSRSRSRDRNWQGRSRERDYHREFPPPEKPYYRDVRRKPDLPKYLKPPRVMRDVTRHPVLSPPPARKQEVPEPEDDNEEVNIVGVLRLLTALEEKLGSLGPKVIDLLGQALATEKTEANSSESLLDNEINCVLFETVKEKLKGQLLAGLVDFSQQKAFKNAIKKIASLMHFANERKKEKEKDKPKADPIKVPGIGTVDKAAIAKQIATALVLQGKTDVTQADLEQLINAVVGMAEASRTSNKPMTTAAFLEQLSQPKQEIKSEPPTATLTSTLQSANTAESTTSSTSNMMEGLSDSDLQTLLQNFKDLCTDEQHSLISYLKKLEAKEPERVERLRKFVNLDANTNASENNQEKEKSQPEIVRRGSPFASRLAGLNPTVDENVEKDEKSDQSTEKNDKIVVKVNLDSDDEEYSFEDVFKAAKQNVKEKEEEKERNSVKNMLFKTEDFDLSNAKSLIANIMGQFKTNSSEPTSTSNLLGLGNVQKSENSPTKLPAGLENFPINLTNLANALNSAQQATSELNRRPVPQNQPNMQQGIPNMVQHPASLGPNQPTLGPNQPSMGQNAKFPIRPQNPLPHGPNNYPPQNISYPHQNPFVNPTQQYGGHNNFNRPNFEHNRHPSLGNREGNPQQFAPRRPGPGQYDNYENRW